MAREAGDSCGAGCYPAPAGVPPASSGPVMELWVALSLGAAFLQNLRTALQKALTGRGRGAGRHLCALPFRSALGGAAGGDPGPVRQRRPAGADAAFAAWALVGGDGADRGHAAALAPLPLRNFAVGNTFARPRPCRRRSSGSCCSATGSGTMPLGRHAWSASPASCCFRPRATSAGGGAGRVAVGRACQRRRPSPCRRSPTGRRHWPSPTAGSVLIRSCLTLACVTLIQTLMLTGYLGMRGAGTGLGGAAATGGSAVPVGMAGMLASLGWFAAFTMVAGGASEGGRPGRAAVQLAHRPLRLPRAPDRPRDARHRAGRGRNRARRAPETPEVYEDSP